jgi:hypothetical protein
MRRRVSLPSAYVWVAPTAQIERVACSWDAAVSDAGPACAGCIRVYLGPVEGPANLRLLSSARHETYESIFRVYRLFIQISRKALSAQWQRTLILSDSRRLTKIRAARLRLITEDRNAHPAAAHPRIPSKPSKPSFESFEGVEITPPWTAECAAGGFMVIGRTPSTCAARRRYRAIG